MSLQLSSIIPPLPSTTRNISVHLSYDSKSHRVCYPSGKSVFLVNTQDLSTRQFTQHNSPVTVAKFAPSGFYIASGDESGLVKIWDTVGDELMLKSEFQIISGRINDLTWDSESKRIIAVGDGKERYGHCFTWDSGNSIGVISGHSAQINAVDIRSVRPFRAATVGDDAGLVFYQGPPFKFDSSVRGVHTNFVREVKFSPQGEFLASVGADRKVAIYEGKTGALIRQFESGAGLYSLAWLSENELVVAGADGQLRQYTVEGELVKQFGFEKSIENQQVGVVVADNQIISLSLSGELNFFEDGKLTTTFKGHQKGITCSALDGNTLYTGSYNGSIVKWDLSSAAGETVSPHAGLVVGLGFNNELVSTGWDDILRVGNATTSLSAQPRALATHGTKSAIIFEDSVVVVVNGETTKLALNKPSAVSIGDKYLAIALEDRSVAIYDSSLSKVFDLPAMQGLPTKAALSANEELLAVGDSAGKIILYDLVAKNVKTTRWAFHTGKINDLKWSPDGDHCASVSLDTNIIIYSVARPMKNIKFLNAHKDGANTVEWVSETELVSGGADACVKRWSVSY